MPRTSRLSLLQAFLACLIPAIGTGQEMGLPDPLEARVEECTRAMNGDCLLTLAGFQAAADAFTRFAREQKDDPHAQLALTRAVQLWREIEKPERVLDLAREFRRAFPSHPSLANVAEEVFLLGELYQQRGEVERAASHYEIYLKEWSTPGGADRGVIAHVRLAAFLLEESCPVAGVRGACIESRQVPFKCSEEGLPADVQAKQPRVVSSSPKTARSWFR